MRESRDVVRQLQGALSRRVVIEQARACWPSAPTLASTQRSLGRAPTRDHNRRLSEVARKLIDGELDAAVVGKTALEELLR